LQVWRIVPVGRERLLFLPVLEARDRETLLLPDKPILFHESWDEIIPVGMG